MRQDDAHEHRRRLHGAEPRPGPARRAAGHAPGARPRCHLPGVRRLSLAHRARQHRVRPAARCPPRSGRGARRDLPPLHGADGAHGLRRSPPQASFRRHAAAPRARPRLRSQAGVPAHGRALRRPRRADANGDAGSSSPRARGRGQDGAPDHAFGRRGDLSLVAHRRRDSPAGPRAHDHRRAVRLSTLRESPGRPALRDLARRDPCARHGGIRGAGAPGRAPGR